MSLTAYISRSISLMEDTRETGLDDAVEDAIQRIHGALAERKPLLICGNGGSAADAMHIAGELVGRYKRERSGLKALALGTDTAVTTAWSNDYSYDDVFARQVEALGDAGGVVWGLSTSGESENVVRALLKGRQMGMYGIGLTGEGGGRVAAAADVCLAVPVNDTPHIQEIHTCIYHYICEQVEARIAG